MGPSEPGERGTVIDALREVYERGDGVQILDVREPYEWQAGRIEGAIHIPLTHVLAGAEQGKLDPDRPVHVVCRSGNRSGLAAEMLRARGYDAYNMEGGMEAWSAAGLPFSTPEGGAGHVV